jgi:hypothetical protein
LLFLALLYLLRMIVIKSQPVTVAAPKLVFRMMYRPFCKLVWRLREKVSMLPVTEFVPVAPKAELSSTCPKPSIRPIFPQSFLLLCSPHPSNPNPPVWKKEWGRWWIMASKKSQVINAKLLVCYYKIFCHFETGENPFAVLFDDSFLESRSELRRMTEKKC